MSLYNVSRHCNWPHFYNNITLLCRWSSLYIRTLHCVKSVRKKKFYWSVFSCIRTVYGEIQSISNLSSISWKTTLIANKILMLGKRYGQVFHMEMTKVNPKCQLHKMVKSTETIRRLLQTNCLSVFITILWGWYLKG